MKTNQKNEAMKLIDTFYTREATGCWDDLSDVSKTADGLMLCATEVTPILRNVELCKAVPDSKGLVSTAKMLSGDVQLFASELKALKEQHADKRGGTTNPDELAAAMSLGMDYSNWIERYQGTVLPNIGTILDHAEAGRKVLEARATQEAATTEAAAEAEVAVAEVAEVAETEGNEND